MRQKLIITDMFNDVFTDYKDKIDTGEMIVDIEKDCECTEYRKCGLCKLVDRYELIDIEDEKIN